MWLEPSPLSCHSPIVSASSTLTHPCGVIHVVSITFVPGKYRRPAGTYTPYGPTLKRPAPRSSIAANTLGESKWGRHIHSTDPSEATSAPVWQSDRNA